MPTNNEKQEWPPGTAARALEAMEAAYPDQSGHAVHRLVYRAAWIQGFLGHANMVDEASQMKPTTVEAYEAGYAAGKKAAGGEQ